MAFMVRPSWNSFFLATQGPMKITLLPGSLSFKYLAIIAMGERLCEILSTSLGNCLWIYDTKAGQHELVRKPFSASSCASLQATMSAPSAASTTL